MKKEEIIQILQRFKHNNQKKYNILKIGIFGSVIKETNSPTSDIDIVVLLGKQDLFNIIGIKQELEDDLYSPVDIISYRNNMNRFLKQRIDNEAIYV